MWSLERTLVHNNVKKHGNNGIVNHRYHRCFLIVLFTVCPSPKKVCPRWLSQPAHLICKVVRVIKTIVGDDQLVSRNRNSDKVTDKVDNTSKWFLGPTPTTWHMSPVKKTLSYESQL